MKFWFYRRDFSATSSINQLCVCGDLSYRPDDVEEGKDNTIRWSLGGGWDGIVEILIIVCQREMKNNLLRYGLD